MVVMVTTCELCLQDLDSGVCELRQKMMRSCDGHHHCASLLKNRSCGLLLRQRLSVQGWSTLVTHGRSAGCLHGQVVLRTLYTIFGMTQQSHRGPKPIIDVDKHRHVHASSTDRCDIPVATLVQSSIAPRAAG